MPLRRHGAFRKRWRYVGVYGPRLMLCVARVEVGPFGQSFWSLWDRAGSRRYGRTRLRPGGREVVLAGPELELNAPEVTARLSLGEAEPVESICASGRGWGWTRKRAGLPVSGAITVDGRVWEAEGRAVDDVSAGYHRRRTSWRWSAGVGSSVDGRRVAWNLVSGINDPPRDSERAIWVDGTPSEPAPVEFRGLQAIEFERGCTITFAAESERSRNDNLLLFRSRYLHRFGTFAGSLDGIELGEAFGVMEEHEAVW
jgi:hypothetical protein